MGYNCSDFDAVEQNSSTIYLFSVLNMRHLILGTITLSFLYFFFVFHRTTGSEIPSRIIELEQVKPDVVMIGNSILRAGIDADQFSKKTGLKTFKAYSNGSASAWWYLYVKNVLTQSSHKPQYAILFFRDHFLTDPCFRTDGPYCKPIRTLCSGCEPRLNTLLSEDKLWNSPLTWAPLEVKEMWETRLMKTCARLLRVKKDQQRISLQEVFDERHMIPELITQKQLASEEVNEHLDFQTSLARSFLPDIIHMLRENNIQPIFVRMKRRRDLTSAGESAQLRAYIDSLHTYLEREGVEFIDFTHDAAIQEAHYGPGDHLNGEGRKLLTDLLTLSL